MLRGLLLDAVLLLSWLTSIGLVVWHEHGGWFGDIGNPAMLLRADQDVTEQWFGIYYQGRRIGFSHTMMTPEEREGVPGIALSDTGQLFFNLLGAPQRLDVSAKAFIDANWQLRFFLASVDTPSTRLRWEGRRDGDALMVTVQTPDSTMTKRLRDPTGGAFVNGLSSWAAFHQLKVGQSGRAWVLNPLALKPETVFFHVKGREVLGRQEVVVVETDVHGLTATTWVTPEGQVLRETSPLGWELRHEPREEVLRDGPPDADTLDLLAATSIPLDRLIEEPARVNRLVLLLEGASCSAYRIERPWQRVLPADALTTYHRPMPSGPWCAMELHRPTRGATEAPPPRAVARYLRPSPFVQSDDPTLRAQAERLVAPSPEPWQRVEAIAQWVFSTMHKRLTIGLPSAVDVLQQRSGDCHEHTVLFTALSRSVGIPTRMVAGLVYQQGRLYYHAWPEVWVGAWMPVDPTLGQPMADITHLGLTEAENESLIALAPFVGTLKVAVLEVEVAE